MGKTGPKRMKFKGYYKDERTLNDLWLLSRSVFCVPESVCFFFGLE